MLMNEDFASCLPCFIISLYLYLPFASLCSTHAACAHRLRAHWLLQRELPSVREWKSRRVLLEVMAKLAVVVVVVRQTESPSELLTRTCVV